jgi:hypothetical protein
MRHVDPLLPFLLQELFSLVEATVKKVGCSGCGVGEWQLLGGLWSVRHRKCLAAAERVLRKLDLYYSQGRWQAQREHCHEPISSLAVVSLPRLQ